MKTIGIYPGNFQPPTRAHLEVYKKLKQVVGPDTFVVTTDRTPTAEAPLNFGDKEQIWVRQGVPASHIRKVDDWKNPSSIFNNFSKTHTKVIYGLNPKEAAELSKRKDRLGHVDTNKLTPAAIHERIQDTTPLDSEFDSEESEEDPEMVYNKTHPDQDENKEVWLDADGKLNYFQPYKGNEHNMRPLSEHGYILIIDDTRIEGKPVSTANIRQVLGSQSYGDNQKKKFFRFVFGWFDVGLYTLVTSKFRSAHQVSSNDDEQRVAMPSLASMVRGKGTPLSPVPTPQAPLRKESAKSKLQKMVREMLGEILDEEYSTTINDPSSSGNMTAGASQLKTPAQQRVDASKQRQDLIQQKKAAELQQKQDKEQRDSYATTVKNYDTIKKKANRDNLDAINKQIANPSITSTTTPM